MGRGARRAVFSTLALSPSLRELLANALGGFAPYAQKVEGVSATDQGIEVRVVSAIADQRKGMFYLEVTDHTGDRLGDDMSLGRTESQSYDPETHTAVVRVNIWQEEATKLGKDRGDWIEASSEITKLSELSPYPLSFGAIYPTARINFEGVRIPLEKRADQVLASRVLSEVEYPHDAADKTVLLPDQTPMPLEGDRIFYNLVPGLRQ